MLAGQSSKTRFYNMLGKEDQSRNWERRTPALTAVPCPGACLLPRPKARKQPLLAPTRRCDARTMEIASTPSRSGNASSMIIRSKWKLVSVCFIDIVLPCKSLLPAEANALQRNQWSHGIKGRPMAACMNVAPTVPPTMIASAATANLRRFIAGMGAICASM